MSSKSHFKRAKGLDPRIGKISIPRAGAAPFGQLVTDDAGSNNRADRRARQAQERRRNHRGSGPEPPTAA